MTRIAFVVGAVIAAVLSAFLAGPALRRPLHPKCQRDGCFCLEAVAVQRGYVDEGPDAPWRELERVDSV